VEGVLGVQVGVVFAALAATARDDALVAMDKR